MKILKALGIIAAIFVAVYVAVILYPRIDEFFAGREAAKFEHLAAMAPKYAELGGAPMPDGFPEFKPNPKPVLICLSTDRKEEFGVGREIGGIDPLTAKLSGKLFPQTAEEVGTVVALFWRSENVGEYDNGAAAMKQNCLVKVIDLESGEVIAAKDIKGSNPPQIERTTVDNDPDEIWGAGCDDAVLIFVESLFGV